MKLCPCGCRKKVPFMRGGAAKACAQVMDSLDILQRTLDETAAFPAARPTLDPIIHDGVVIKEWLKDHIHGSAHPRTHPNLLQITGKLTNWNQRARQALEQLSSQAETQDQRTDFSLQGTVDILEADPILANIDDSELRELVPEAIRQAIKNLESVGMLGVAQGPVGTSYLELRESGEQVSSAEMAYQYAKACEGTDKDFCEWNDQDPITRYSIMAMHHLATTHYFKIALENAKAKHLAEKLIKRRIPQFGSPTPYLMDSDNQPLAWEVRKRVMSHWATTDAGRKIPTAFDSATMYYRELLRNGEV